ncbi:MAG: protein phosphatase 2C domain-containing protein [Bacteroidia bacterium]|nr:protein phosphatase 2C domain-containing protein [Bacteroidia bacterium]
MRCSFVWAVETHVGYHREHNEDQYASFSCPMGTAFIVCDGMGGHAAGDVAAALAIQKIKEILDTARPTYPVAYWLRRAFFHAHHQIQAYAQRTYDTLTMGTAAALLLITPEGEAWWAHTGDSRLYLLREGRLHRLTHDHSYVHFLVDSGYISPESAFGHPQSNQLIFTLGASSHLTVVDVSPYPLRIQKGDLFLLCSDGLSGLVPDERIAELLQANKAVADRVRSLIHAALDAGGYDNITALLIEITAASNDPKASSKGRLWTTIGLGIGAMLIGFLIGQVVPLRTRPTLAEYPDPLGRGRISPIPPSSQMKIAEGLDSLPSRDTLKP